MEKLISKPIEDDDPCSICLISYDNNKEITKCNHEFHKDCIDRWLDKHNTCPICRVIISDKIISRDKYDVISDGIIYQYEEERNVSFSVHRQEGSNNITEITNNTNIDYNIQTTLNYNELYNNIQDTLNYNDLHNPDHYETFIESSMRYVMSQQGNTTNNDIVELRPLIIPDDEFYCYQCQQPLLYDDMISILHRDNNICNNCIGDE